MKTVTRRASALVAMILTSQMFAGTALSESTDEAVGAIDVDSLLERIGTLASDEFGGRAPMSEGERLTLNYLESQFREMGLEPMFGDSYRQPVPLVSIEADPAMALSISDLEGNVHSYSFGSEVALGTPRVVAKTGLSRSELVWVGYGIVAPEYEWNDYAGLDVKGKTVIILVNDPGYATQNPDLFNGNAMTYYGRWTYKYEEAARQGADGALIIHQTAPAAYGWNVVENGWVGPQFKLAAANNNMDQVKVQGWLQYEVADELFNLAGMNLAEMSKEAAKGPVKPNPMGLMASVNVSNTIVRAESYNVGAILPGSEKADELFIYMAHWDHLGTTPHEDGQEGDFIYNGALDNASGTAGMIEIAEVFTSLPKAPRRSVGFLAVTAEESGLLGSKAYVADPPFAMNKTAGGVNMDGLNFLGKMSDIVVRGYGSSEMENILAEVALPHGRTLTPETTPEKGSYYRSDHFNFARQGVPILYAGGGTVDRAHGSEYVTQRKAEYIAKHYHDPSDEIRDDWDMEAAIEDLVLYYEVGKRVADSDDWPQWYEGNEFRAIREASLSEAGD